MSEEGKSLSRSLPEIPEGWEPFASDIDGVFVQGFVRRGQTLKEIRATDVYEQQPDGSLDPVEGPVVNRLLEVEYALYNFGSALENATKEHLGDHKSSNEDEEAIGG